MFKKSHPPTFTNVFQSRREYVNTFLLQRNIREVRGWRKSALWISRYSKYLWNVYNPQTPCTADLVKSLTFQIFYYEHALIQIFFALRMIWLLPSFEGGKNFYYIRWVTNGYNLSILIIGFDKAQSVTPFLKLRVVVVVGGSECKV